MKKLQKLLTLGLAAAGAAVLLTGCGKKALEGPDLEAASWDQITEAARDTTVTFYGWGAAGHQGPGDPYWHFEGRK